MKKALTPSIVVAVVIGVLISLIDFGMARTWVKVVVCVASAGTAFLISYRLAPAVKKLKDLKPLKRKETI